MRGECCGAVGGPIDLAEELSRLVVLGKRHLEQRREALDRREQIIEVVGDAAGQQSHRLHLLRHAKLGFELPVRGHVGDHRDRPHDFLVAVAHRRGRHLDVENDAVFPHAAHGHCLEELPLEHSCAHPPD